MNEQLTENDYIEQVEAVVYDALQDDEFWQVDPIDPLDVAAFIVGRLVESGHVIPPGE